MYAITVVLPFTDYAGFHETFDLTLNSLETKGIFCIMCYFWFVKSLPEHLYDHVHALKNGAILKHQNTQGHARYQLRRFRCEAAGGAVIPGSFNICC